jgi:lipopolysaccharide/colanic/teichoic acid biosynthesis glycosyltransferase
MTLHVTDDAFARVALLPTADDQISSLDSGEQSFRNSRAAPVPSTHSRSSRSAKRTGDVVIGVGMCLLTSVVVLMLMVGSAISFRAMPLFAQSRIEKHGRRFRILKIRSLPTSAPTDAGKLEVNGLRTTGFGHFIRRTHLDELPQLWLVLGGRMSLVGPRPAIPCLMGQFAVDHLCSRSSLRPGCTGLWQISPSILGEIYDGSEYDLFYAEQMCGRLDLWILWHTGLQAVGGSTKTLADIPLWACANPSRAAFQRGWTRNLSHVG